eukprot:CAMPEP_0206241608 /NCGR_PEP_ID=MMETSP0047_2-20121206/16585_1 /ASSEMBLY_ACC=CAM_ASM_000192 /TAXON_ID=195065 /ORGANISM="Chroomonas mesostigmatica_cf, Strain CCMP1168" /LENGTH=104 /DNA_ID=CAMNT_0053666513 /DNA_START=403 /DNA_END=714 /DNA_ORIENTATION=-
MLALSAAVSETMTCRSSVLLNVTGAGSRDISEICMGSLGSPHVFHAKGTTDTGLPPETVRFPARAPAGTAAMGRVRDSGQERRRRSPRRGAFATHATAMLLRFA